jgi:hypothetical protein
MKKDFFHGIKIGDLVEIVQNQNDADFDQVIIGDLSDLFAETQPSFNESTVEIGSLCLVIDLIEKGQSAAPALAGAIAIVIHPDCQAPGWVWIEEIQKLK